MSDPKDADDYIRLTTQNHRIEGFGVDTRAVCPCPFCAAPDWLVLPLLTSTDAMKQGAACKNCGRSAKFIMGAMPGIASFELVQTGGDDPPEWLTPNVRRA